LRKVLLSKQNLLGMEQQSIIVFSPSDDELAIHKEFDQMKKVFRELRRDKEISPVSLTEENIGKNRYTDVLPYEETRVKLQIADGEKGSDYINANHINIGDHFQQYICCQAPLPNTFDDFWRMLCEQHCPLIVMLTRLEEKNQLKAHKYWPDEGQQQKQSNGLVVTHLKTENRRGKNIIIRSFSIGNGNGVKWDVTQLHYTTWPDMGVPESPQSMQELLTEVDVRKKGLNDPIVVHCSAGIGRTGTFIAIHLNMQKAIIGEKVDVMKTVLNLRLQRDGMVQSADQYKFVYAALKQTLTDRLAHRPHDPKPRASSSHHIHSSFSEVGFNNKNIRFSLA